MKITGTFIDEISHDIPAANWGPREWAKDFDAMKHIGIDTVIVIRAGYRNLVTFNSKVINKVSPILPAPFDLVDIFLNEAERCGMNLYFGTYDSGKYWMNGDYQKEVDINKAFTEEVVAKYGHRKAFRGWYICHEVSTYDENVISVYQQLARHLKSLCDIPILISPYIHGKKQFAENAITLNEHILAWDRVFEQVKDSIDIVAFQDGNVDYQELPDYLAANSELSRKHGLTCWSNVETFDRDMPFKFPPIGWRELYSKMVAAEGVGVEKMITFEFSHFMSPNSIYMAARNLYQRYLDWMQQSDPITPKESIFEIKSNIRHSKQEIGLGQ